MSWQDVTRSSLCSCVKEFGTQLARNFLFPKSSFSIRRTAIFEIFKDSAIILDAIRRSFLTKSTTAAVFTSVWVDFCYHSWCDSTTMFDQINNSSGVYLSSSRFWTDASLVIFYQHPSVSKSRIPPKSVWSVHSPIATSRLHQYQCFCRRQTGFETKFRYNSLFIPAIHDVYWKLTLQDKLNSHTD